MSTRISSTLHSARSHNLLLEIATLTGHSDAGSPPALSGWAVADDRGIFIRVAQDAEEQIVHFELWDNDPAGRRSPPPSRDDLPVEVQETFTIDAPTGELAFRERNGTVRNVFTVRPGRYHARIAGRQRKMARERAAAGRISNGRESYTVQLWPESASTGNGLVAATQHVATTGYGMFGFYDENEDSDHPEPEITGAWFSATSRAVDVRPMCQLPEPGIRFELWADAPPGDVLHTGDEPEVQKRLKFQVTQGSIALYAVAAGSEPGAFSLPPGGYHLHLLGYRRSIMPTIEKELYAREISPLDDEWKRTEGTELYVARFWPEHDNGEPEAAQQWEPDRLKAIRTWAKTNGLAVNDSGPIPPTIIAQYDAATP
ncbi:histone-like nucleoid-structuring protein Lsr2 [Actinomadura sp. 7K507]|uniref:Lsr2 family DNA-binding protein n=1 Tax=Actinomadura sp. 7K507 TaxID=2530365 RepID=UPI001404EE41|nr:histone-like nucleoid-structuring protein Lsr2 [Actinomadura sp. 7K507]